PASLLLIAFALGDGAGISGKETSSFFFKEALVHVVEPASVRKSHVVIMVPGHNLSSSIYLTTPDGRPGWAYHFADSGYKVYAINDPKFDFSRGFPVEGFTEVPEEGAPPPNPGASRAWNQDIWQHWGFGLGEGDPYPDSLFPSEHFEEFESLFPWHPSGASHRFAEAVTGLLEEVGPAILVAHSAGAPHALIAAMRRPDLTAGLVLVEPTDPPTEDDFPTLRGVSMLGVYGDYIESRSQTIRKDRTEAGAGLFRENGGAGAVIDLPRDYGVEGNSHLLMQGTNNGFSSGLILEWLEVNAGVPRGEERRGSRKGSKGGKTGKGERRSKSSQLWDELDENKDGTLNREEFGSGRRFANTDPSDIRNAFEAADRDGNGRLSEEEFSASIGSGKKGGRL
ncbi:MAG: EF-hand domain-containing protein, partial [Verrucomicrobiota bacterium]